MPWVAEGAAAQARLHICSYCSHWLRRQAKPGCTCTGFTCWSSDRAGVPQDGVLPVKLLGGAKVRGWCSWCSQTSICLAGWQRVDRPVHAAVSRGCQLVLWTVRSGCRLSGQQQVHRLLAGRQALG